MTFPTDTTYLGPDIPEVWNFSFSFITGVISNG